MKATSPYYENFAREAIIKALLSLMESKPFEQIRITDITAAADVARRTFYLYYYSKVDVLNDYYAVLTREYDDGLKNDPPEDSLAQVNYFFSFWNSHRDYLKLLYDQGIFYILLNRFHDYLAGHALDADESSGHYEFAYSSGGLWAVLHTWVSSGFKEKPEVLAGIVSKIGILTGFGV